MAQVEIVGVDWLVKLAGYVLGASLALAVLLALLRRFFGAAGGGPMPYRAVPSVVTEGEAVFLRVLLRAVPRGCTVLAKVRLADLVEVTVGGPERRGWLARVAQKHVDFVLADAQDFRTLLLVELDDRSHRQGHRAKRDEFVDACARAAGLPLLRVTARREYDEREVRQRVAEAMRA